VLGYPAGIPICTIELAKALRALPQPVELVGAYATARWWDFRQLRRQVAELGMEMPISWVPLPGRLAGRLKGLPWRLARPRLPAVDLIHVTSCLPPLWLPFAQATSILTVYDLGFLLYPDAGFGVYSRFMTWVFYCTLTQDSVRPEYPGKATVFARRSKPRTILYR
jgi:hypothetical protein